jgi:two-component system chemotaxis response regulator CheB
MTKKVLIVDDSYIMRTLIKSILTSDKEFEIVGDAQDGVVALEQIRKLKPDVVMLDIEMPNMDGIECLKKITLISRAKVIIISSVAQTGSPRALQARQLGAFEVLSKPSGAMSLDLTEKRGSEIVQASRRACGLPAN